MVWYYRSSKQDKNQASVCHDSCKRKRNEEESNDDAEEESNDDAETKKHKAGDI